MEQQHHLSDLTIDSTAAEQLKGIAGWGKFLGIIGFVFCGLMLIVAIFAGAIFSSVGRYEEGYGNSFASGMGVLMTVVYLVIAIIYFIPTLFLFQASQKLQRALSTNEQDVFNTGLAKLKSCFKFWGIITIIMLAVYALAMLVGGLAAIMK